MKSIVSRINIDPRVFQRVYCPELALVLFLTAGVYKADPTLKRVLLVDPTLFFGILVFLAVSLRLCQERLNLPRAAILLLPMLAMLLFGLGNQPSDYGAEKALHFCTLTILGMAGVVVLVRNDAALRRFSWSIFGFAGVFTLYSLYAAGPDSTARLRLTGSNPLWLAKMALFSVAFCWLALRFQQRRYMTILAGLLALLSLYVVMATGSRGPVLSFVLGGLAVAWAANRYHGQPLVSWKWVVGLVVAVTLLAFSGVIPTDPLERFQHLVTGQYDRSLSQRSTTLDTAWRLLVSHPFGIGVGNFAEHGILDIRHPHNVLLEVGIELGWISMLCLAGLFVWCLRTVHSLLKNECSWNAHFLAMVVLMSGTNAMVSGDLNDNRLLFAVLFLPSVYLRQVTTVANVAGLASLANLANPANPATQASQAVRHEAERRAGLKQAAMTWPHRGPGAARQRSVR